VSLRAGRQLGAQRSRCAQDALREKRSVDERLALAGEVEEVRRGGINGARNRAAGQVGVLGSKTCFIAVVRGEIDPGRDAGDQPAERFEVSHTRAVRPGRLLDWHACLQRPGRQVREHRIREATQNGNPRRPLVANGISLFS
jgi:hypothetical protein